MVVSEDLITWDFLLFFHFWSNGTILQKVKGFGQVECLKNMAFWLFIFFTAHLQLFQKYFTSAKSTKCIIVQPTQFYSFCSQIKQGKVFVQMQSISLELFPIFCHDQYRIKSSHDQIDKIPRTQFWYLCIEQWFVLEEQTRVSWNYRYI